MFQKTALSISSTLELLNELERKFDLLSDEVGKNVPLKLKETLSNNVDLLKIRHFNAIINGHESHFLLEVYPAGQLRSGKAVFCLQIYFV